MPFWSFFRRILFSVLFFVAAQSFPSVASAAILSVSPSTGTFELGSVFDVDVILNTENDAVNAMSVEIRFPPEKLQLVLPTTGKSIISLWITQPSFDNAAGTLRLEGVIPGGINASSGLVTKLHFRVKGTGQAFVKFTDSSRVLAHDGKGTDALHNVINGVYSLTLPPPLGPIVASPTHPDQSRWYPTKTALFEWTPQHNALDPIRTGFSYVLNSEPLDFPDDVSEGMKRSVAYKNLSDDTHYFHIKSLQGSSWGGTTHFVVNVDTTPPAEFPLQIVPSSRTSFRKPVLQFSTTDALSGMSHYEMKLVPLSPDKKLDQPLFVEAQSPFVFGNLDLGRYDVILRAYDNAGNYREETEHLAIIAGASQYFDESGVYILRAHIPWWLLILLLFLLILLLYLLSRLVKRWRAKIEREHVERKVPQKITGQLKELEKYHERYGKIAVLLLFALSVLSLTLFSGVEKVFAQTGETEREMLNPPLFESVSEEITNEDIFYAEGKTTSANADVILYVQNARTGEVISEKVTADSRGEWFYRHDTFLDPGTYILWAQAKTGEEVSPPSPERSIHVRETVLRVGSSRFSYNFIYLAIIGILFLIIILLIVTILVHVHHGKILRSLRIKEVREAEDAVRTGFAKIRQDIAEELGLLKKLAHSRKFSAEEEMREKELMTDLEKIEAMIGKEVLDIERVLR